MKTTYMYIVIVVVLFLGVVLFAQYSEAPADLDTTSATQTTTSVEYDTFAQCLTDAGVKFYGAFWCPHCQEQKTLLQHSDKVPYIECSTPDSEGQTQICKDEKIVGYPTWKFTDGSELSGVQALEILGDKTNCEVPSI